jgi:hypothetical protein
MLVFGILIGIAIGYFFKPQLDHGMRKLIRYVKDHNDSDRYYDR